MLKNKMTMLILSCDNFSDLWDGHVKLLEENWSDRGMDTMIVTEGDTDKRYDHVGIFRAGAGLEWSERLQLCLQQLDTPFVFLTLDDYFLIEKVDHRKIQELLALAEKDGFDYIRLYPRPKRATGKKVDGMHGVFRINTNEKYSVNLYSAIWRVDFLKAMLNTKKNAWQFEVGLSAHATDYGARCAVSHNREFVILDVVRKGKLLHRSAAYFKRHTDLYSGNRAVQPWPYEIKLWIKTMVGRHTPKFLHNAIRTVMKNFGYKFVSDDIGE